MKTTQLGSFKTQATNKPLHGKLQVFSGLHFEQNHAPKNLVISSLASSEAPVRHELVLNSCCICWSQVVRHDLSSNLKVSQSKWGVSNNLLRCDLTHDI